MDPAWFLEPSASVIERLLAAGGGCVSMMTLAPELPGALQVTAAIATGYDADLAVLDDDLRACSTMVAGRWVGGSPS